MQKHNEKFKIDKEESIFNHNENTQGNEKVFNFAL